jgi:hypothetical protein
MVTPAYTHMLRKQHAGARYYLQYPTGFQFEYFGYFVVLRLFI